MTLCEKCIHGDVCAYRDGMDEGDEKALTQCSDYKNKADFVEVVRCKDCKYFETPKWGNDIMIRCVNMSGCIDVNPDDFCSYGKRKGGAE